MILFIRKINLYKNFNNIGKMSKKYKSKVYRIVIIRYDMHLYMKIKNVLSPQKKKYFIKNFNINKLKFKC